MRFQENMFAFVQSALNELDAAKSQGKVSATPVSEENYLAVWLTRAIKQQRFASIIAPNLLGWQKQARSHGSKAGLKNCFEAISATYQYPTINQQPIDSNVIETWLNELAELGWQTVTEHVVDRKVTHFTAGQASLVICRNNAEKALKEHVTAPLVLYVRGPVPQLIATAAKHGLFIFKSTDYKSKVKYHGEYRIYPNNDGPKVPEII